MQDGMTQISAIRSQKWHTQVKNATGLDNNGRNK